MKDDKERNLELSFLSEERLFVAPEVDFEEKVSRKSYDALDKKYQSNKKALRQRSLWIDLLNEKIKELKKHQANAALIGRGKRWREATGALLLEIAERGRAEKGDRRPLEAGKFLGIG